MLSDALHGWTKPLVEFLGRPPHIRAGKVSDAESKCVLASASTCAMASPKCRPCRDVPDCYEAPGKTPEFREAATRVAMAWKEGRYVIVIEGGEFSL